MNGQLKTNMSINSNEVFSARRTAVESGGGGGGSSSLAGRHYPQSTGNESDDASSGSFSSSIQSYHSDIIRSPEHVQLKLGGSRGFPPKPSPRPSMALSEGSTRIANIEELKERLSNTHKKNKERRRASLASHFSGTQSSSGGDIRSPIRFLKGSCTTSFTDDNQSLNEGEIFLPPLLIDNDVSNPDGKPMFRESSSKNRDYNLSGTSTILFGNIVKTDREKKRKSQIKKDQIIESIVWFSFHIPRTVLEDLIAHELQIWSRNLQIDTTKPKLSPRKKTRRANYKSLKQTESTSGDNDSDVSVSSLSDDGSRPIETVVGTTNFTRSVVRREHSGITTLDYDTIRLPKAYERESAILFVDMSGFTKLSTLLDVESLSKIINSYFDLIVSEVILYGGDILKFAGDAFFAEWRVADDTDLNSENERTTGSNPLSDLNASLVSINEIILNDTDLLPITRCVMMAAKCASSIVKKFSDYHVTSGDGHVTSKAMLNVHCGVGVGQVVGLHVRDCKDGEDEDAEEVRREFLLLGNPIDQVSNAADAAKPGEAFASPEALMELALCCELTSEQHLSDFPLCIASRDKSFLKFDDSADIEVGSSLVVQLYESLRLHCKALSEDALYRLNLQMALYVHPVIRADELALSSAIQSGKISQPTETLESRHRAEAELRSVYTMFISAVISPRITGNKKFDEELYNMLADIMWVTSRELDRYSGHLRQFIVDDKGVVLIATFGLRGSTFPNMVENNCLPATFAIHRSLKTELKVENRIGATFGKVYCGIVGGVRRHEFACMGAPVNLAARLMSSKENNGILVDQAVHEQCRGKFTFKKLPPVKAKGYDKPVPILEPIGESSQVEKKRKSAMTFVGRSVEKEAIYSIAKTVQVDNLASKGTMIFLTGESGMGKSALAVHVLESMKKQSIEENTIIATSRSNSTETEQRIPLRSFRKIFICLTRQRCEHDEDTHGVGPVFKSNLSAELADYHLAPENDKSRRGQLMLGTRVAANESTKKSYRKQLFQRSLDDVSKHTHRTNGSSARDSLTRSSLSEIKVRRKSKLIEESISQSLHRKSLRAQDYGRLPAKESVHVTQDDSSNESVQSHRQSSMIPYFEKLCQICEELEYPFEYADIVGSQFLGFECSSPITHVDGHIPSMDELVEFLALVFIRISSFAQFTVIFLDDFQWVDGFSWRVFREICSREGKILLICATRSHDKQALRRISSAATPDTQQQSQMIEVSLGPFDFTDIRELMANVLLQEKSTISDSLCSDIFQRTGGLPVFVIQLLENIKRMRTLELVAGALQWTAEGLKQKKNFCNTPNGAVMEETFLSRFDALDVRVRKVLQTCAVWGIFFQLSDVVQMHPEMDETDIELSLDYAIDEMILLEQEIDEHDEDESAVHHSEHYSGIGEAQRTLSARNSGAKKSETGERYFQFSHATWRKNVLATMLKVRKNELHRSIAESIEKNHISIYDESDISRLLTLFDHWKACGDFSKVAPLALEVGARLEEWDLSAQSLELYEDALTMVFDGVETTDEKATISNEWIRVKSSVKVLEMILRLHVCVGLCYQRLGDEYQSILYFEDAYNTVKTSTKLSATAKTFVLPILSSLCVLKLDRDTIGGEETMSLDELLIAYVEKAEEEGSAIHIGRSLATKAFYFAKFCDFKSALEVVSELDGRYDIASYSEDMVAEYGRNYALECLSQSAQWLYLMGMFDEAEQRADFVIDNYLSVLDLADIDGTMYVLLPIIQLYSLLEHAQDAYWILKKYVINPYHDNQDTSDFWVPIFNPLAYLLEVIIMDESDERDDAVLNDIEEWVLDERNYVIDSEIERKAHTMIGELCWRLLRFKAVDDPSRDILSQRTRDLLEPIAHGEHHDFFQKSAALALLDAL